MNANVYALAVIGNNLFAGTDGSGVFLSTDNGTSWNPVNTGLNFPYVHALSVVPIEGGGANIFCGRWGDGIFFCNNNGTDWTPVNSELICRVLMLWPSVIQIYLLVRVDVVLLFRRTMVQAGIRSTET